MKGLNGKLTPDISGGAGRCGTEMRACALRWFCLAGVFLMKQFYDETLRPVLVKAILRSENTPSSRQREVRLLCTFSAKYFSVLLQSETEE